MEPTSNEYRRKIVYTLTALAITFILIAVFLVIKSPQTSTQDIQGQVALLSNLHRGDLIVFEDNRIWCVRNDTAGSVLQVVEWNGNAVKTLSKTSFVMGAPPFKVLRPGEAGYDDHLRKYAKQ